MYKFQIYLAPPEKVCIILWVNWGILQEWKSTLLFLWISLQLLCVSFLLFCASCRRVSACFCFQLEKIAATLPGEERVNKKVRWPIDVPFFFQVCFRFLLAFCVVVRIYRMSINGGGRQRRKNSKKFKESTKMELYKKWIRQDQP